MRAYNDLGTCRTVGMSVGPIPWRDIYNYAIVKGLEPDVTEAFIEIIRDMDSAFLEYVSKKNSTSGE